MLKFLYEMYNSLKGFIKKWDETTKGKKVGRNDKGLGAKRLGCRGETSWHQIWGETTRGELVLGRNHLLSLLLAAIWPKYLSGNRAFRYNFAVKTLWYIC